MKKNGKSKYLKITALVSALILNLTACDLGEDTSVYQTGFISMDTYISFTVYGNNRENAAKAAQKETQRLEALFSVTDPNSEVSKINSANGASVKISDDTANVIQTALRIGEISGGALDVTLRPVIQEWGFTSDEYKVPMEETLNILLEKVDYKAVELSIDPTEKNITLPNGFEIDLGAVAKGYAGDKAIEILKENGITSALVNFGGNVQTVGTKPDGTKWNVAVRSPFDESNFGVLKIKDQAVVTSGAYERYFEDENGIRYHHIIDPANGYPARSGIVSATIVGESGCLCDALSTAVFVMGAEKAAEVYRILGNFEMLLVTDEGKILITEGLEEIFENRSEMTVDILP